MEILPIQLVHDSEQHLFGSAVINLSRIYRSGLSLLEGYVITPPDIELRTILEHFKLRGKEVFEQTLNLVDKEVNKMSVPDVLLNTIPKKSQVIFKNNLYDDPKKLYQSMIKSWLEQIKTRIWHEGFSPELLQELKPLTLFITSTKIKGVYTVESYFDPELNETVINSAHELSPAGKQKIDDLTLKANKLLVIPQIYNFVITDGIYLVDIKPYTHPLAGSVVPQIIIPKVEEKKLIKSTVKVFMDLTNGFTINKDLDGVIIRPSYSLDDETLIFKIAEAAISFSGKPVIYQLADDPADELRGALRLIHDSNLFNKSINVLDLVRTKKQLYNVNLSVPFVRSAGELLQVKKLLHDRGFQRQGSFKLWMEVSLPENIINLDSYLLAGVDGVVINIDSLMLNLYGIKGHELELGYKEEVQTLIKFLKPALDRLHKEKILTLVLGLNILHPTLFDYLLEAGVYGIVANNPIEADSLPEHISWSEKRMILRRY